LTRTPAISLSVSNIEIAEIDRMAIAVEPWCWDFAVRRRTEIDRHFTDLQRRHPAVWNGRVLLLNRYAIREGTLHGACFETDYASFCAWRNWNLPDASVYNVFAVAALRSADGAYLVGEMAPDTAAAGSLYFPCGTPEPADLDAGGALDLGGNLGRELKEETGLDVAELDAEPGWSLVRDRGYIGLLKRLAARENAEALRARIMRHIASEAEPELVDIRILREPADLDPRMPGFVVAFLKNVWRQELRI
jgi:8-oxo-dGTP pyrophosphatase MutT (NUDIX family)